VAESHDPPPGRQLIPHPSLAIRGPDVLEHVEHGTRRAAVQRTLRAPIAPVTHSPGQSGYSRSPAAVNVDAFMPWSITVTQYVFDRARRDRVGLLAVHHVQKVRGQR